MLLWALAALWPLSAVAVERGIESGSAGRVVPGRDAGFCNATTCDDCVRCADDGVSYGRGCMWCYDGRTSEHTCFNFYSDGGSKFCTQFAALNQCDRASRAIDANERDHAPEWLPLVGAVGACVLLAFGVGLWATRAQLSIAMTAQDASRLDGADEIETAPAAQEPSERANTAPGELCVVCLQNERTRMLYPCGHLACCEACGKSLVARKIARCPICRKPIRDVVRVYG